MISMKTVIFMILFHCNLYRLMFFQLCNERKGCLVQQDEVPVRYAVLSPHLLDYELTVPLHHQRRLVLELCSVRVSVVEG
jgi:hypothetical protein